MDTNLYCRGHVLDLKKQCIMGILNVTPDSFSDGGKYVDVGRAVEHAYKMVEDGADIIDIGGESSRPGCEPVSEDEELRRVIPVVKRLAKELSVPLSIDTYKSSVARACLEEGVCIVNDISGLRDPVMAKVVAQYSVPVVVMHMPGMPKTMKSYAFHDDPVNEVKKYLEERVRYAHELGIQQVVIDPGFGFGKNPEQNYAILTRLSEFQSLECPILLGPSRKLFCDGKKMLSRLEIVCRCVKSGAHILRVHDVKFWRKNLDKLDENFNNS